MTLNHSAVDVFFHMTNHYRRLKRVKSTIDNSLPEGLRSRPRNNRSKATKEVSFTKPGNKPKSLERSPHYQSNSRVTKKYSSDNEVKSTGSVVRSVSLPPRPSTRRNPKDMPHTLSKTLVTVSSMGSKIKPIALQRSSSHILLNPVLQEQSSMASKSSTTTKSSTNRNIDYAHFSTEPALPVPSVSIESCSSLRRFWMSSEGIQPQLIKQSSNVPDHEYLQFALRITEDIIRNDLYSNEEMRRVFNSHIEANRGRLDSDKMNKQIEHLCMELNIPLRASKDFGTLTRAEIDRLRQNAESNEPHELFRKNKIGDFKVTSDTKPEGSENANVITGQIVSDQENNNGSDVGITSKPCALKNSLEPLTENTEPTSSHDTIKAALNRNQKSDTSLSEFDQPVMLPGLDDLESSNRMNGFLINVGVQTSKTSLVNKSEQASKTNLINKSKQTSEPFSKKGVNDSSSSEMKVVKNVSSLAFCDKDKKKDYMSDTSSKHSSIHHSTIRIVGQNNIEEEFILVPGPIYVPKSAISYCKDTSNCTPTYSQIHENLDNVMHYPSLANNVKDDDLTITKIEITESKINRCFENCENQQLDSVQMNQSEFQLNDVDLTPQRELKEENSSDSNMKSINRNHHQCVTCNKEKACEDDAIQSVPNRDISFTKLLLGDEYLKSIESYNVALTPTVAKYFPTAATQTSDVHLLLDESYEVKNPEEQTCKEKIESKEAPPVKQLSFAHPHDVDGSVSLRISIDQSDSYSEDMINFSALQDGDFQKSLPSLSRLRSLSTSTEKYTKRTGQENENTDEKVGIVNEEAENLKKADILEELDQAPSVTESFSIENNIMKVTTDWERFRQIEDNPMLVERQSSLKDLAEIMEKNFEKEEAQSQKLTEFATEPSSSAELSTMNEEMSDLTEQTSEDNHVGCCGIAKKNKKKKKSDDEETIHRLVDDKFSNTTINSVSHTKSIRFEETDLNSTRNFKSEQRIPGNSSENDQNLIRSISVSKDYELQAQIREFSEALLKKRSSIAGVPERFSYSSFSSDPSSAKKTEDSDASLKSPHSTVSMEDSVSVLRIKKLANTMEK